MFPKILLMIGLTLVVVLFASLAEAVRVPYGLLFSQLGIRGSKMNPTFAPREPMAVTTEAPEPVEVATPSMGRYTSVGLTEKEVRMILRQAGL